MSKIVQLKDSGGDNLYPKTRNLIYHEKLTTAKTISITGLDLVRDGGIYDFFMVIPPTTKEDLYMTFNNISTETYNAVIGTNIQSTLTTDGNPAQGNSGVRLGKRGMYYGFSAYGKETLLTGTITMCNNHFMMDYEGKSAVSGCFYYITGVVYNTTTISNVTSLQFLYNKVFPIGTEVTITARNY